MKIRLVSILITLALFPFVIYSQETNTPQPQKKIALVIGNGNYQSSTLANPENDARAMKVALQSVGFTVFEYENLTQGQMKKAIDDFGMKLKGNDVGLFFYAGHGIQSKGYNYLIPVDAQLQTEQDVEYDCVQADRILAKMEGSGTKVDIIILDACRNNPFERSWTRSETGKGLAFMNAPSGTLIAYATSPGNTASDGSGNNGLYTSAILESMRIPNINIIQMFQNVRSIVSEKSNKQQIPWESTSLVGDFYFSQNNINDKLQNQISPGNTFEISNSYNGGSSKDEIQINELRKIPTNRKLSDGKKISDTILYGVLNHGENKKIKKGSYLKIFNPIKHVSSIPGGKEVNGLLNIGYIIIQNSSLLTSEGQISFKSNFRDKNNLDPHNYRLFPKKGWSTIYFTSKIGFGKISGPAFGFGYMMTIANPGIGIYGEFGVLTNVHMSYVMGGGLDENQNNYSYGLIKTIGQSTALRIGLSSTSRLNMIEAGLTKRVKGHLTFLTGLSYCFTGQVYLPLGLGFSF
jgi:hypothetical protein